MDVKEIYDRVMVARWIINSDSAHKEGLLRTLMNNNNAHVLRFSEGKCPIGWILYHYKGAGVFVDYISVKMSVKEVLSELIKVYDFNKITMMTTRPKAWGRLMGFKEVGTIMEKEIK
jgi:hypothetical protein